MDKCCHICRTPSGVCATAHQCEHHITARLQFEARRTVYRDPTGERAVGNVMAEKRRKRRRFERRP